MSQSKKKNKAVALRYNNEEDMAPIVIASGYGNVAEQIINVAEQEGIPVFRDDSTASLLCMLEVGENIPTELYEVVSVIYKNLIMMSHDIKSNGSSKNSDNNAANKFKRLKLSTNISNEQD